MKVVWLSLFPQETRTEKYCSFLKIFGIVIIRNYLWKYIAQYLHFQNVFNNSKFIIHHIAFLGSLNWKLNCQTFQNINPKLIQTNTFDIIFLKVTIICHWNG